VPISRFFPASDWQKARDDHAGVNLGLARLVDIGSYCSLAADTLVASAMIAFCPIAGKCQKMTIAKDVSEVAGKL
jgi:hypothetical protein